METQGEVGITVVGNDHYTGKNVHTGSRVVVRTWELMSQSHTGTGKILHKDRMVLGRIWENGKVPFQSEQES